jgi:uncharacterized protein YcfJ
MLSATQAVAQVTFYEREGFEGRSFTTHTPIENFGRYGFNDRASSVVVGRDSWEICDDVRYSGRCVVLGPGQYPSLASMGMNNRASSVRAVSTNVHVDERPYPAHEYRRREHERLYEANVTLVRAVMGPPEQRCWMEREQVVQERSSSLNVPAAIVGAVVGGILGHQVGRGRGNDIATAGGAVGGAAVGANVGRDNGGQQSYSRDVQRCVNEPSQARPAYWDVTYNFRGVDHGMQLMSPPGATVTVNERGEPRE